MLLLIIFFITHVCIISYFIFWIKLFTQFKIPWLVQLFVKYQWPYEDFVELFLIAILINIGIMLFSMWKPLHRIFMFLEGFRKPNEEEKRRLDPAIAILQKHAPMDLSTYRFYIRRNAEINALATGRKEIGVEKGLLFHLFADEIAGILAHELGHLECHHSIYSTAIMGMDRFTVITINMFCCIINLLVLLSRLFPFLGLFMLIITIFFNLHVIALKVFVNIPLFIAYLFNSRGCEYEADRYACEIGLGSELYRGLDKIDPIKDTSWWNELKSTHPNTDKRLKRIEAYCNNEKNKEGSLYVN